MNSTQVLSCAVQSPSVLPIAQF